MKVYLSGPIKDCTDEECKAWRQYVYDNSKFETISPMRRDYREDENAGEKFDEIVEFDKADIQMSDALLVNMGTKLSVGTLMETIWAYERGKLIIVVTQIESLSPWLVYHSHKIFNDLNKAIKFLNDYQEGLHCQSVPIH